MSEPLTTDTAPSTSNDVTNGHSSPGGSKKNAVKRPPAISSATEIYLRSRANDRSSAPVLKKTLTWANEQPWVNPENQIEVYSEFDTDSSNDEGPLNDDASTTGGQVQPVQTTKSTARRRRFQETSYGTKMKREELLSKRSKSYSRDGRLKIAVNQTVNNGYLAKAVKAGMRQNPQTADDEARNRPMLQPRSDSIESKLRPTATPPKLNIVIIVIGSRGDIQPFLKIGKILKSKHGHRVRLATHPHFKEFVEEDAGLEFFSVGGDPSELMAFMVKNPGLIPNMSTIKSGEIGRRRSSMFEMFQGMWKACASGDDNDPNVAPFVADAIIANPPSFAHIHIAERLAIPLHIIFTFPYTPTTAFPHPLANIKQSNAEKGYTNFMSYPLVEMMTWQGLGDLVNKFRTETLGMDPVSTLWAPGMLYRLRVHTTYLWSPSLVKKPEDWGPEIDIAGFVFLSLGSKFKPPQELVDFLDAGPPPLYIGFGSIVVDDPDAFTELIFKAVEQAGVRALVSKGWGGIGGNGLTVPDNIFLLENTPHDWLFPRCSAVIHHGGAGTTAIGLKCAKPTMIVPFFGDQPFWGNMVANARAGAFECVPHKNLTLEAFVTGIQQCLSDEAKENVAKLAEKIEMEGDGAANAVRSFQQAIPLQGVDSVRCSILEDRVAVWRLKRTPLRISAIAAEVLMAKGKIKRHDLRLVRCKQWNDFQGPGEPITGFSAATVKGLTHTASGVGSIPSRMAKRVKQRRHHEAKKERHKQKLEQIKEEEALSVGAQTQVQENNAGPAPSTQEANGNVKPSPEHANGQVRPETTRQQTQTSELSADPSEALGMELAQEAGHGVRASAKAIARLPMELPLAVAQGFHNAPRLYGDETVRNPPHVSNFKSGLKAGRDEFGFGMHDAVAGLYKLPAAGKEKSGIGGCLRGVGMAFGGLILKPLAAIMAPVPYAMKGVQMSWRARKGEQGSRVWIKQARIIQGKRELAELQRAAAGTTSVPDSAEDSEHSPMDPKKAKAMLHDIEKRVEDGWRIISKLIRVVEDVDQRNYITRFKFERERKLWRENGALETVDTARIALEAREQGTSVEDALEKYRKEKADQDLRAIGQVRVEERHDSALEGLHEKMPSDDENVVPAGGEHMVAKEDHTQQAVDANDFATEAVSGAAK